MNKIKRKKTGIAAGLAVVMYVMTFIDAVDKHWWIAIGGIGMLYVLFFKGWEEFTDDIPGIEEREPTPEELARIQLSDAEENAFVLIGRTWRSAEDFDPEVIAGLLKHGLIERRQKPGSPQTYEVTKALWSNEVIDARIAALAKMRDLDKVARAERKAKVGNLPEALAAIRQAAIEQRLATSENVNDILYNMPVEQFKELAKGWPMVSRVDFKSGRFDEEHL